MALVRSYSPWRYLCFLSVFIYFVLAMIIAGFVILTIIFGSLWLNSDTRSRVNATVIYNTSVLFNTTPEYAVANGIIGSPARLPNDGKYVQWTFLQMNDVYELLPLDKGSKGGLARVAYLRQLLKQENNNTITVLSGDLVSPSAIGTAKVNGTALNGKQMIATMNTLGLDYMTFGNHEFDLSKTELLARMTESTFTWISSNVFLANTSEPFGSSLTHRILTIEGVRILLIGLTVDGTGTYVSIINQSSLVNYTQTFLNAFPNDTYDVLVALTHLDIATDIQLAAKVPQIDLIIGGHDHENYYYLRGSQFTQITKADANAVTVYIHRCAFNVNTTRLRIYSTLARVTPEVPEDNATAMVANYWFNLGIAGFQTLGYQPSAVVSCLPAGVELDGLYESVTTSVTLLSAAICEALLKVTASFGTTIGLINGGTIRIDDVLRGTVTQYDVIRTLPFPNEVVALAVPGAILANVLITGMTFKGAGLFIGYTGIETSDEGSTWLVDGVNVATSGLVYRVATSAYVKDNTNLTDVSVVLLQQTGVTQTRALIDYLTVKYPPC